MLHDYEDGIHTLPQLLDNQSQIVTFWFDIRPANPKKILGGIAEDFF
jgi:hypothetical protein